MEKIKGVLPYVGIVLAGYYLLPLLIKDTGAAMTMLLVVIPAIIIISAIIFGAKHGFNIIFPLVAAVLFLPSVFIFYNASAWIYTIIYGIAALVGNVIGMLFRGA